ncbi:hypothetical protein [Vibrio phage vB_VruC_PG21]|uniref:Uncharacterized protein n=1 Tax=Vibrio phage vB_VruC_PG21 TaxID=2928757 RepID=A0AAE9GN48_9VIRU|nr:hypothetical protein [Vibrio sp. CK2-1]MCF7355081.1 hypothetical protein [Vibrio sp. CK2-1]UOL48281.1 hypothetical protein [Vibrio phage vB_VruC_PG21]
MKISAVTEDQVIVIDGSAAFMADIGGYHMTNGEWAVHFDTTTGYGEIEYIDNRPNQFIDEAFFNQHFAWLQAEHQRYLDHIAQLEAENESENTGDDGSGSPATPTN